MYTNKNNKNYLGTGYKDKVMALRFGVDSETVFPFDENIYIYKKYINHIQKEYLNKSIATYVVFGNDAKVIALSKKQFEKINKINESF